VNVSLTSELSECNFRIALCVFDIVAYHIFTVELTRLKNVIPCLYRLVIVCSISRGILELNLSMKYFINIDFINTDVFLLDRFFA